MVGTIGLTTVITKLNRPAEVSPVMIFFMNLNRHDTYCPIGMITEDEMGMRIHACNENQQKKP